MKSSAILWSGLLVVCAVAAPVVYSGSIYEVPGGVSIDKLVARGETRLLPRQLVDANVTANGFLDTGCKDIVLVYARGSTQDGNLVSIYVSRGQNIQLTSA